LVRFAMVLTVAAAGGFGLTSCQPLSGPVFATLAAPDEVPEAALEALAQGRFFRASRILDDWLAATSDSTPTAILLAARASAGWYDWGHVIELLDGRPWMDAENGGEGWSLLGRAFFARKDWESAEIAFGRFAGVAGDAAGRDVGLAHVRRGEALRQLSRVPEAFAAYDRGAKLLPDLAGWIDLVAAEAAAAAGDTAIVSRRLTGAPPELAREWGWAYRVDALRASGDAAAALAVADDASRTLVSATRRARALAEVAELATEDGDAARAREAFRRAVEIAPGSIAGVDAARALAELDALTPRDRLAIGRVYLRHGNYERAVDGIEYYLAHGQPPASEREQLRRELANALFNGHRYDQAERQFLAIAENASSAAIAADALFFAGRSQYRDGRITQGQRTFDRVAERYPAQPASARALYIRADLAQDDGATEAARSGFRRAVATGAGVEEVGFAYMRLGALSIQEESWSQAIDVFESYRRRWPEGRRWGQATYWSAVAHGALGRDSVAHARYVELRRAEPISYYGGLAAEQLGEPMLDFPMKDSPRQDRAAEATVSDALAGYDLLRELEWEDAASWQLSRIRARFASQNNTAYALAEALNERGMASMGIALGWELYRRNGGWNLRLLRIVHPFPFRPLITAEARDRGVDPYLAAGLIRQESMFQPRARSGANAIGLMQVVPETGAILARSLGVPRFSADMLTLPEINVLMGVVYLKEQIANYDGRLPLVLGAYNAGPQRITRWREFPEFRDDALFAERIPYEETRDYVKIVQQNAKLYAGLWSDGA
jgi:soluble lytic murein transglycosylase